MAEQRPPKISSSIKATRAKYKKQKVAELKGEMGNPTVMEIVPRSVDGTPSQRVNKEIPL